MDKEIIEYLKHNLKIETDTKSRKIFGLSPKPIIKLYLEGEFIFERDIPIKEDYSRIF